VWLVFLIPTSVAELWASGSLAGCPLIIVPGAYARRPVDINSFAALPQGRTPGGMALDALIVLRRS